MPRDTITDANGDGHFGYGELLNPTTVDALITQHNEHAAALDVLEDGAVPLGGGSVGPGTTNKVAKFVGATAVDDSQITDDGTNVSLTSLVAAKLNLGSGASPAMLAAAPTETADWNPWGGGTRHSLVRVQCNTAGSIIKSLSGGTEGDVVILENHGDNSGSTTYGIGYLLIRHHKTGDVGITVGNNIYCPHLADVVVPYTGSVILYYDSPTTGWIMLGMATGDFSQRLLINELGLAGAISPSVLAAGDTNNFNPSGGQFGDGIKTATWLRLVTDASGSSLTGIQVDAVTGTNPIKLITCLGSALTLKHESTSSSAANRFAFPGGKDITLLAGESLLLGYDALGGGSLVEARWRVLGSGQSGYFTTLTLGHHVTPGALSANEHDWSPTGWKTSSVWRVIPGPTNLTGMVEVEAGAIRVLTAYGAGLTIVHQSASSAARNRFYNPGAVNFTLNAGESATFRYDTTFPGWFCIGWTK